jgi:uncharacterized protein YgiM (DUF1202 family)
MRFRPLAVTAVAFAVLGACGTAVPPTAPAYPASALVTSSGTHDDVDGAYLETITEVHVRTGPGEQYPIVATIADRTVVAGKQLVTIRATDGAHGWYRLAPGRYVSADVVSVFQQ